ncbi:MAG: transcriptional regulator [Peptococcaceae bacterium]
MDIVVGALNFLILYVLVKSLFNFFSLLRQNAENKEEQAEWKETEAAGAAEPAAEKEIIEMVTDHVCGCTIPKAKAYILSKHDQDYYFCSWECRDKFIKG